MAVNLNPHERDRVLEDEATLKALITKRERCHAGAGQGEHSEPIAIEERAALINALYVDDHGTTT